MDADQIPRRPLGRTGEQISIIGLGDIIWEPCDRPRCGVAIIVDTLRLQAIENTRAPESDKTNRIADFPTRF
jgi:hypothetical protein